jgi:hypothetical protein
MPKKISSKFMTSLGGGFISKGSEQQLFLENVERKRK